MHSSTNSKLDKHDHHEYDRVSTIENSLNLIDDTPVTNGNTNDLHDNTFDNHIPNNCLPKVEQEDFSASNVTQDYNIEIPDRIEREIQNEFEILEKRLKIEELGTKEIQHLVDVSFINVKRESWKSALVPLKQLLKQINSLNMQEMFRLVEKVNDAAQLIKNKNIILFLGGTGSGKSTIIHFFGGSKMAEQEINGLNHIAPVEITNSDLKNVTTSPFARSETRYITPVTVNIEDVGGNHSDSIILCDTPGFDDTSGVEVDIANGIGIVKAIKGCKRVKPVVLISYKSIGDRLE
ncbi:unnamed protein product, partial [Rotaria sp. Silwood2]